MGQNSNGNVKKKKWILKADAKKISTLGMGRRCHFSAKRRNCPIWIWSSECQTQVNTCSPLAELHLIKEIQFGGSSEQLKLGGMEST